MMIRNLTALFMILSCSFAASAAMYKHVDEKGRVTYSQSPPVSGKAEVIKPPPPAATQVEPSADKAGAASDKSKTGTDNAKQDDKRQAESDKIKAENCARARKSLEMYKNVGNRLVKTADGLYQRMTEEKREEGMKNAERNIKEFCN